MAWLYDWLYVPRAVKQYRYTAVNRRLGKLNDSFSEDFCRVLTLLLTFGLLRSPDGTPLNILMGFMLY
jgi:hypothetical protein